MIGGRLWSAAFVVVALAVQAARGAPSPDMISIYVGKYTDGASRGIYRLALDPANARLTEPVLVAQATNPSFLAWHPSRSVVYAVSETDTVGTAKSGALIAFAIDERGGLTRMNEEPS